jgi:hypothetical protein
MPILKKELLTYDLYFINKKKLHNRTCLKVATQDDKQGKHNLLEICMTFLILNTIIINSIEGCGNTTSILPLFKKKLDDYWDLEKTNNIKWENI